MDTRLLVVSLVICLVGIVAGCLGPTEQRPTADVALENVTETVEDGRTTFRADLVVRGNYERVAIEDLQVEFVAEDGTVLDVVRLGSVENRFRNASTYSPHVAGVSTTVAGRPERVRIRTGEVRSGATVEVHGLRRNETGGYEYADPE